MIYDTAENPRPTGKCVKWGPASEGLRKYNKGESNVATCNALNFPESTLCTIRKDREKIATSVKAGAGSSATRVLPGQSNIMVWMEKKLVMRMDHRMHQGLNVTFDDIKNKATDGYSYLKEKETGPMPDFVASKGWFYKFKVCYDLHSIKRSGEAKNTNEDAAASYLDRLRAIIKERGLEGGGRLANPPDLRLG